MSFNKKHLLLVILALAVGVTSSSALDMILGDRVAGDSLAFSENFEISAGRPSGVPPESRYSLDEGEYITRIEVRPHDDLHGGYALIHGGGVGARSVRVKLVGQGGRPFKCTVNVYAKKRGGLMDNFVD